MRIFFRNNAALALFSVTTGFAAAAPPERPFREAFVVETDGSAEKKLAAVAEYVGQRRWDAAVSLLREVAASRPDAVVRVGPRHSLSLSVYCDVLLTRLPVEGLAAYRRGVDPQAAAWLSEAGESGDERPLRLIAERAFASSAGDEAIDRLAEGCWERGEFDAARHYWTCLVPAPVVEGEEPLPLLRYPDTNIDLAGVRARLILCSVALGETVRAERELAAFRNLHPDARGWLAGREGLLDTILAEAISTARPASSPWTPQSATHTLGAGASRGGHHSDEPPMGPPAWFRPLPASEYVGEQPALPRGGALAHYPVVWRDKTFVADAEHVYGFDLATGRAAWSLDEKDAGIIYPPAVEPLDAFGGLSMLPSGPLLGAARHTLTVEGDRLYARLGPPVTSWPQRDLRRPASQIVCLDLAREGLLAWSLSSDSLGSPEEAWSFEGPPVAAGDRLYLLVSRSRPQSQLNALCLDAATGTVLWNRSVGAPISTPPEGAAVMTHRLATIAAGRLFVQTNHGAVVCLDAADGRPLWVGWYESEPPRGAAANSHPRSLPAACLVAGGVAVAAPSDSDRLFAFDAASGAELWSRPLRGEARELVGARDGVLVVSGERLQGLNLFTGRERWSAGYEDPAGAGAGRGLLAGRAVYWPTRQDLFVIDVETGSATRRVRLKAVYGFDGGANLAASADRLLLARPEGLMAFGR